MSHMTSLERAMAAVKRRIPARVPVDLHNFLVASEMMGGSHSLLVPNFLLIIVIRLMDTFRVFDFIYIMTSGGPGGKTETIGFLSYERTFRHFNMGQGSVIAIFILVVVLLISWYFIRILQKELLEQVR